MHKPDVTINKYYANIIIFMLYLHTHKNIVTSCIPDHQITKLRVGTYSSLIGYILKKCGSASSGRTACSYNRAFLSISTFLLNYLHPPPPNQTTTIVYEFFSINPSNFITKYR